MIFFKQCIYILRIAEEESNNGKDNLNIKIVKIHN